MPRGGPRANAGRPVGKSNKATIELRQRIEASGLMPLDFLLSVMRDEGKPLDMRLDAAKAVAPYAHPRLSAVTHKGDAASDPIRHEMVNSAADDAKRKLAAIIEADDAVAVAGQSKPK